MDIRLTNGSGLLRVQVTAEHTFRIRLRQDENFVEPSLVRYGIVRNNWPQIDFSTEKKEDKLVLRTSEAALSINQNDGRIIFSDSQSNVLLESASAPLVDSNGFGAEFLLANGERLFGLGDVTRDSIQKRGHKVMMWETISGSELPIPFLMSSCGWAVFVNTTWRHFFDLGHDISEKWRFWGDNGELDFYIIAGNDLATLLNRYTDIIGKPMVMPLSGYGLSFCATKDADARAVLQDCINFRRDGFACDIITLEPTWMSKTYDYTTKKEWHLTKFRIPYWLTDAKYQGTFIGAAERMGFKLCLWLCCDYDVSLYEEYLATGNVKKIDKYLKYKNEFKGLWDDKLVNQVSSGIDELKNPEPWFEHLIKFVDQGVSGFMMDHSNIGSEHPTRKWGNGMDDEEMHNLYPVLVNKQMQLGFKKHTGRRCMLWTSAGYSGIQRYAATWAGDTGGGEKELVSFLNHGLSGHSNTSCDIITNMSTPESIHFGLLHAWAHLNAWITWDHPSYLGDKLGPIFKFYLTLRYKLLPYIYSLAHVANRTGMPIVRAMPLMYPDDPKWDNYLNQYMLGDYFLVGAFTKEVELPKGRWVDFWNGKWIEGEQHITGGIPENRGGHLFVRAGAIIPCWPEMDYVGQKTIETLDLHVYPFGENSFTLYEDDGVTYAYCDGAVATTTITCRSSNRDVTIEIGPRVGKYDGMPETRRFHLLIHSDSVPGTVLVNGSPLTESDSPTGWSYHEETRTIHLEICEDIKQEKVCVVRLANIFRR